MTTRSSSPGGFDRVAGVYRLLELVAFGGALQRARTAHLDALRSCRDILVLGDGDGRCLDVLLRLAPEARVVAVDASAAMLARARQRIERTGGAARVTFQQADLRTCVWPVNRFDAVVSMFVLDCFAPATVEALVTALMPALRPGGRWLLADFAIPERGWRRWHAALWVGGLYAFFRLTTGLEAAELPPSEALLLAHGLSLVDVRTLRFGLLRSVLFERPAAP